MIKKPISTEIIGRKDATKVPPKIKTKETRANTIKNPIVINKPKMIPRKIKETKDS